MSSMNSLVLLRYSRASSLRFTQAVSSPVRAQPISAAFAALTTDASPHYPVQASIEENLRNTFQPTHLQVINESHMHNVPKNSETHFKVVVVSDQFDSVKSPVARHRLVNAALAEQLHGPVHALSIVTKTPAQWQLMQEQGETIEASPKCAGGDGSLPKKNG